MTYKVPVPSTGRMPQRRSSVMENTHSILAALICVAAGIVAPPALAQQPLRERTVGAFLEFMAAKTEADCARNREAFGKIRAKAPPREQVLFEANEEICGCMKQTYPEVLRTLTPEVRSRTISDPSEIMKVAGPALQKCSSLVLRSLFGGKTCPAYTQTMIRENLALDAYCGCMKTHIDTYSDAKAVETGNVVMDYLDALGKASREGAPLPPRPALIEPFHEAGLRCAEAARAK
jgi:hypothetical protein